MDLFAASGIDLGDSGGGKRARARTLASLRVPLFNHRVLEKTRQRAFSPSEDERKAAADYARKARASNFAKQKETAVRNQFIEQVLGRVLGYEPFDPERPSSLALERPIRTGFVDVALGTFKPNAEGDAVIAPLELKGPGTADLDAVPSGRRLSPVEQAWSYANDTPGARWVLVSNCVELRLYAPGRGRDAYEAFDLRKLDEEEEHRRLWVLLSREHLLGDFTASLLRDTDAAYKQITDELYGSYSKLRTELLHFLMDSPEGPRLAPSVAIEQAQKVLDRVLFVAFAQRTDLLRDGLLARAAKERNPFAPQPLWTNFQGLFRYLDRGDGELDITAYNGGLFAPDPVADSFILPDHLAIELAKLGDWDYRSDVPVTVLGRLFEQSITDLEKERAKARGEPEPEVSQQKRHGVVYTPDAITRFVVERTLGRTLRERFAALSAQHGEAEATLWEAYLAELRAITVLDPACGSGAFLVAAFDLLAREYRTAVNTLARLDRPVTIDVFDDILARNLYGVDLNAESVEITRLSLWLKTARRHHRLQALEATVKVGDSLVADPAYTERPFDWQAAFSEVFARGGFDIVIGNPPYVRMERIKPFKPYLAETYVVAADRADLYSYFFERGVRVLKPGGRLGYISSSTFFKTGSGENLRTFLADGVAVETVVDFGDVQLFEGVTTYPAILTLKKEEVEGNLDFLKVDEAPDDLETAFAAGAAPMPRARLGSGSWTFEDEALAALRDKIRAGRPTLGEVYGPPLYGIKTGLNEAFVIDTATRDRLVAADPRSAELLKPFLRGEDVKRWHVEPAGLFLINTPKGKVDIDAYPAVRDWLLPFRDQLEARATQQQWWELQQAQLAYQPKFEAPKIIYQDITNDRPFTLERDCHYPANTCYCISTGSISLLSLLSSKLSWFMLSSETNIARGGYLRLRSDFVSRLPLPIDDPDLAALGDKASVSAVARWTAESETADRILDLAPPERRKLNRKLERWWELDFAAFRAEVKRALKADIPLRERRDWETYLAEQGAKVRALDAEIAAGEAEIDRIVYRLFDLTPEEITLIEASLAH
jgi:hypothetical protein